jgi:hypothetical protein
MKLQRLFNAAAEYHQTQVGRDSRRRGRFRSSHIVVLLGGRHAGLTLAILQLTQDK